MIIGLKSANETKYWLKLIGDTLDLDPEMVDRLLVEANELSKIIAQIILNTKAQ